MYTDIPVALFGEVARSDVDTVPLINGAISTLAGLLVSAKLPRAKCGPQQLSIESGESDSA